LAPEGQSRETADKRPISPHWVFWGVGITLILAAVFVRQLGETGFWPFWAEVLASVGISVLAVSMVEWLWRQVGGEPLLKQVRQLQRATALLRDLDGTGIVRVYSRRDDFKDKDTWLEMMRSASQVDMLGIALQHNWANDPGFREIVAERAGRGRCRFRFLVFDPDSDVVAQRDFEECAAIGIDTPVGRIQRDTLSSLSTMHQIRCQMKPRDQPFLEIKVVHDVGLYCSMIRVDRRMLVTKYLFHCRGSKAPTIEVAGGDGTYWRLYEGEFEAMWQRAKGWPSPVDASVSDD